jgi:hypothetical protein
MQDDGTLFERSGGSPLRGYLLMRSQRKNVPPKWIERYRGSRERQEKEVAKALKNGRLPDVVLVESWERAYRNECFYQGIRALMELERSGRTKL